MTIHTKQNTNPDKLDTTQPNPKRFGLDKKNLDRSDSELDLVDPPEAAKILNTKPQTLSNWRITKSQPLPYYKIGRSVKYNRHDLFTFIRNRCVTVEACHD